MNRHTFDNFRRLVYEKSGINLGEKKEALVCARVGKRMRALGINDYKKYLEYLSEDESGREIVELLDAISTNVTYFFRENQHFELLRSLVREWADEGRQRLRIWSAACSTGEEPYSIAMILRESLNGFSDAKILATDISTKVLEQALSGVYEKKHVEKIPRHLLSKYFVKKRAETGEFYHVKKDLRQMVTFGRLNLSVQPFPLRGPLDVIFCRNVMIYFDNNVRKRVLENMYSLLRPGGYLMVGHAESLTGLVSDFKRVESSVYTKG